MGWEADDRARGQATRLAILALAYEHKNRRRFFATATTAARDVSVGAGGEGVEGAGEVAGSQRLLAVLMAPLAARLLGSGASSAKGTGTGEGAGAGEVAKSDTGSGDVGRGGGAGGQPWEAVTLLLCDTPPSPGPHVAEGWGVRAEQVLSTLGALPGSRADVLLGLGGAWVLHAWVPFVRG